MRWRKPGERKKKCRALWNVRYESQLCHIKYDKSTEISVRCNDKSWMPLNISLLLLVSCFVSFLVDVLHFLLLLLWYTNIWQAGYFVVHCVALVRSGRFKIIIKFYLFFYMIACGTFVFAADHVKYNVDKMSCYQHYCLDITAMVQCLYWNRCWYLQQWRWSI